MVFVRDMDLIRDLLLRIESGEGKISVDHDPDNSKFSSKEELQAYKNAQKKLMYHLDLLRKSGIVDFALVTMNGDYFVRGISWEGHDFLETVRDPKLWANTKKAGKKIGSFSMETATAIAKGLVKKQIEKHTGVEIDL